MTDSFSYETDASFARKMAWLSGSVLLMCDGHKGGLSPAAREALAKTARSRGVTCLFLHPLTAPRTLEDYGVKGKAKTTFVLVNSFGENQAILSGTVTPTTLNEWLAQSLSADDENKSLLEKEVSKRKSEAVSAELSLPLTVPFRLIGLAGGLFVAAHAAAPTAVAVGIGAALGSALRIAGIIANRNFYARRALETPEPVVFFNAEPLQQKAVKRPFIVRLSGHRVTSLVCASLAFATGSLLGPMGGAGEAFWGAILCVPAALSLLHSGVDLVVGIVNRAFSRKAERAQPQTHTARQRPQTSRPHAAPSKPGFNGAARRGLPRLTYAPSRNPGARGPSRG